MSKIISKENQKKIIMMIVIIMLFNFVMPNCTFAIDGAINGGIFFKPIAQFIAHIADLVIQVFQSYFVGSADMVVGDQYLIRYSPGIIFTGTLPAFDTNFINPNDDYKVEVVKSNATGEATSVSFSKTRLDLKDTSALYETNGIIYQLLKTGFLYDSKGRQKFVTYPYGYEETGDGTGQYITADIGNLQQQFDSGWITSEGRQVKDILKAKNIKTINVDEDELNTWVNAGDVGNQFAEVGPVKYKGKEYKEVRVVIELGHWSLMSQKAENADVDLTIYHYDFKDYQDNITTDVYVKLDLNNVIPIKYFLAEDGTTIESIAKQLKGFISTWYKALREVALVGLLLVLVYVAIRMILSTTAKDKAKYKKMLIDWVTAVCIIFIMHYLISITITVTNSISKFISANVTGEYGEDVLMSSIRREIGETPPNFMEVFPNIVMYVTLVVYTVLFTIQYLKRTIYLAFLVIISPLVAFTYPLDKIKDGQAQAFSSWLREYIYTSLIQPVHLILYVMLVSSAMNFAKEIPIYAIVVIGFLLPAEKFVKAMFGFDRASTLGNMTSTFGGAAVMNAINKLGSKGGSKEKKSSGGAESGGETTSKTRMANSGTDPYEALRGGNGASTGNAGSGTTTGGTNSTATTAQTATGASAAPTLQNSATTKEGKFKKVASGVGNVAGKYGRKALRGVGKVTGAAALGTIGLAGGIATGDMSNAFAGLAGGIVAGSKVGGNIVDGVSKIPGAANGVRKDIVDTFRAGAYGKDEAARIRFDKEFKKSEGYKNLIKENPGAEGQVEDFLAAGITDTSKMGKAIKSGYSTEEAIAYMKLASTGGCPDEVLYDENKFKTYLDSRGIDSTKAEEIRKGIVAFK